MWWFSREPWWGTETKFSKPEQVQDKSQYCIMVTEEHSIWCYWEKVDYMAEVNRGSESLPYK